MHDKKRGKWRRAEEQITKAQRRKIAEMLRDGYTVETVMDRFGLTDDEQVLDFYADPSVAGPSPFDRISMSIGFRTTVKDVYRDIKGATGGRSYASVLLDNGW